MHLTRRRALAWLVLIFLVAAGLRLYGLFELSPPGLSHDEVANWLIVRRIFNGEHSVYFPYAYGHEAGFHYVQALFVNLLGSQALALRLPAAFSGLLGIAVTYALNRRLFGRSVALLAAALLASLFWSVFYSRQGLRAISLPLLSGASAYIWWRAWGRRDEAPPAHSNRDFLLAGLVAGLSMYTYMAARTVPIFYAGFTLYLVLFHRAASRRRRRGMAAFWLIFALVSVPLLAYLQMHPEAEVRVYEVNEPMRDMFKGNFRPVVDNFVDILAGFGLSGDPLWRQGVPFRTVFHPLLALFFYGCLLYSIWRVADARYGFLLLWIFTAFIPSLMTIDAPSTIRMINILPVLTTLPAIVMHRTAKLSTEIGRLSTARRVWFIPLLFMGILLFRIVPPLRISRDLARRRGRVQFTWQTALRDAAHYLDEQVAGEVAIGVGRRVCRFADDGALPAARRPTTTAAPPRSAGRRRSSRRVSCSRPCCRRIRSLPPSWLPGVRNRRPMAGSWNISSAGSPSPSLTIRRRWRSAASCYSWAILWTRAAGRAAGNPARLLPTGECSRPQTRSGAFSSTLWTRRSGHCRRRRPRRAGSPLAAGRADRAAARAGNRRRGYCRPADRPLQPCLRRAPARA